MLQSLLLISLGHYHGHFIEFQRCSDRYISYVQLWPLFLEWVELEFKIIYKSDRPLRMIRIWYTNPPSRTPLLRAKTPLARNTFAPNLATTALLTYIYYGNLWDHSIHAVVAKLGANELDDLMQIFANLKEALCFLGGWQIGRLKSQSNHPWIVFGNPIYI